MTIFFSCKAPDIWIHTLHDFIFSNNASLFLLVNNLESVTPKDFNLAKSFSSTNTPAITNGPMTGPIGELT